MSASQEPRGPTIRYFGDYLLLGELGGGGMGIVYSAQQVTLNRAVALKLIRSGAMATESERRRFRLEAEAAAKLDHPNIVPIFEIGTHEGQLFVSMKLIEGESLALRISNLSPISNHEAATLLVKIARAVQHAHERGVLHRDLKPANILLDGNGEPHLADFGLAKLIGGNSSQSLTGEILGTPDYMSPEQAAGQRHLTGATDIYSLGAVLFALLTGRPPFHGESPGETLEQVQKHEPPHPRTLNPSIDPELQTICLKCLEKEPKNRYASAEAFADDLERWLAGEVILARPVSAWQRVGKWIRRNPVIAGLSGLLVVGALLAAVAGTWLWNRAEQERLRADGRDPARRIAWQTITGGTVQAEPNRAYRIRGSELVTIRLPVTPATGDVFRITSPAGDWRILQNSNQVILTEHLGAGAPGWIWTPRASGDRQWTGFASSADGKKLAAVEFGYLSGTGGGAIFTSADAGQMWTERAVKRFWLGIASSADGENLVAIADRSRVYISHDSGVTWTRHLTNLVWTGTAMSADGTRIVAVDNGLEPPGGQIHISTDGGETWRLRESRRHWHSVAMSADGLKLAAVEGQTDLMGNPVVGYVYTSADGGTNWTVRLADERRRWISVAMSPDGRRIVAAPNGGFLYVSADGGATWRAALNDRERSWSSVVVAGSGQLMVAIGTDTPELGGTNAMFISRDGGRTWTRQENRLGWGKVGASDDGRTLLAGGGHFRYGSGSWIYTSTPTTAPGPAGVFEGGPGSELELEYIGGDQFRVMRAVGPLNIEGTAVRPSR